MLAAMRVLWILTGLLGLAAVALGAYGSHAAAFAEPRLQAIFETGLSYHFAHLPALGLAALIGSLVPAAARRAAAAGALFLAGMVLFCGALYLRGLGLADLTNPSAPAGGFLLMAGWLALAWAGLAAVRPKA
jgi:uncharacterized membrane protein YgdD (TMEM256/DUF423 family)